MRANLFYKICIGICLFTMSFMLFELYEENYKHGDKVYRSIIADKYIGNSGGWESGVLKFKFKYNNDTIIQEQYGSNNGYDVYKINDTVDIYYNPNASATSIICVKLLSRSNRGFIIMILGTLLIIVILLYKIKTYKGEMLFLED